MLTSIHQVPEAIGAVRDLANMAANLIASCRRDQVCWFNSSGVVFRYTTDFVKYQTLLMSARLVYLAIMQNFTPKKVEPPPASDEYPLKGDFYDTKTLTTNTAFTRGFFQGSKGRGPFGIWQTLEQDPTPRNALLVASWLRGWSRGIELHSNQSN